MAERSAWVCLHKAHDGQIERRFLLPDEKAPPRCSLGHAMTRQPNRPYKGKKK